MTSFTDPRFKQPNFIPRPDRGALYAKAIQIVVPENAPQPPVVFSTPSAAAQVSDNFFIE